MTRVDFPQTWCLGGVARRDITPPVGMYHRMWGAATHDRSTGIHRPLSATALALAPQESVSGDKPDPRAQVVVVIDHCIVWSDEMDALRATVARGVGLAVEQVHVALSHTHAAGLLDRGRGDLPGGDLIGPYLDKMTAEITAAVQEALATLRPVRIVYGTGCCSLAKHRDFWDEAGQLFTCGFNPRGTADDTLLVARISDEQSKLVATIVNYACHPTTLAWDNTLVSPDYIGALRELVESSTGAPCLFFQGASGDLGPRDGFVGDVEVADRNGRQLAYAALATLESLPPAGTFYEYAGAVISGATIGTWAYQPLSPEVVCAKHRWQTSAPPLRLDYRADLMNREQTEAELARWHGAEAAALTRGDSAAARDCRAQVERMTRALSRLRSLPPGDGLTIEASLWRLGDAFWVFVAGEHYQALQRTLREKFPSHPIVVTTITDGWLPGYVPTADTYGKGIYQESVAIVAPGSLEKLIDELSTYLAAWAD